ncbi:hypothetical protein B9Z65_7093 [Elsinoe australis]|uniref:Heme oxygenase-like protein n=1 Tax=Elsinoe australis TaxID=40998 RepID=A0A2P7Z4K7_9PEZI|nr:hypothetical protein B9Z65_7093 [Elsinoe australis]
MATSMAPPEVPERLLSPLPPAASETLSFRINAATRNIHTSLNKLVTARLALAIPPYTSDPTLYLHGIHTFAQLYFTFEDSWQDLICAHLSVSSPSFPSPSASQDTTDLPSQIHTEQLRSFLATLIPPTLWRTQRLESDIAYLSKHLFTSLPDPDANPLLRELKSHITASTSDRPHVLLAYSWVLYMAIFSGGRWIRSQLRAAGPTFWGHPASPASILKPTPEKEPEPPSKDALPTPETTSEQGIYLFNFSGPQDGEDIKSFFKEKFAQADTVLSETEKEHVVKEASWIFEACVRLVADLDGKLGTLERVEKKAKKEKMEKGMPEGMRRFLPEGSEAGQMVNPTIFPGSYVTKGLDPFAAMLAIAIGISGWYLLHSWGVVGQGLLRGF